MNGLRTAISQACAPPAKDLVAAYFAPDGPFAGATFDNLPNNEETRYTPEDLVAVSLLDVHFNPLAVRLLLDPEGSPSRTLRSLPLQLDLWDATDDVLGEATHAWSVLRAIDGIGPTKASKLLARKRPQLVPIVDSVIRNALPLGENSWESLREALRASEIRSDVSNALPDNAPHTTSLLRVLDVAVWMTHSRSKNARTVRERLVGDTAP